MSFFDSREYKLSIDSRSTPECVAPDTTRVNLVRNKNSIYALAFMCADKVVWHEFMQFHSGEGVGQEAEQQPTQVGQ